jgi:glutamate dehydrogenase (NAD(P)+)
MTYKYCFFEREMGGAKAGLQISDELSVADRQTLLRRFGYHIGPLLRSNIYVPWTDMNCHQDDLACVLSGAGLPSKNITDSAYYTALSTFAGIFAVAEYLGIPPYDCKITIEGLGKVGMYLAKEIARWGGKIIGISTRFGSISNTKGINVEGIIKARHEKHDYFVKTLGYWDNIPCQELFHLPMNIHVPCARIHSLTRKVAGLITAKAVVPAANVPCTAAGEAELRNNDVLLLPDFVVNAGGAIGSCLADLRASYESIRNFFLYGFKNMILRSLDLSEQRGESPVALAKAEAYKSYRTLSASAQKYSSFQERVFQGLKWRGLIPNNYLRRKAYYTLGDTIKKRFSQ